MRRWQNAVFILSVDHNEMLFERGWFGDAARIPLIITDDPHSLRNLYDGEQRKALQQERMAALLNLRIRHGNNELCRYQAVAGQLLGRQYR